MPSSVIERMSYDARRRVLTLVFREGRGTYCYFDVPPEVWAAFQAAESKGTYLNGTFKEMGFGYRKMEPVEGAGGGAEGGCILSWPRPPR